MVESLSEESDLRPVLPLALRRRARSLCSLNEFLGESAEAAGLGRGGTRKVEGGMVTGATGDR